MTELHHPATANILSVENRKQPPGTELHHIAELLEELVSLLKDSIKCNKEIISDEPSPTENEVMTIKEAAAMLRISLPTMYEYAHSGRIHCLEIGRRILVSRSSIMALLREGDNHVK